MSRYLRFSTATAAGTTSPAGRGGAMTAPPYHLDYATWHARLAGHNGPVAPAPPRSGRRVPLDLETWRAYLAGSGQRAA